MNEDTPQFVDCPGCKTRTEWRADNPHRPFCSDSCRNKDFIAWANEDNAMPGNPVYDDILSDDL